MSSAASTIRDSDVNEKRTAGIQLSLDPIPFPLLIRPDLPMTEDEFTSVLPSQ